MWITDTESQCPCPSALSAFPKGRSLAGSSCTVSGQDVSFVLLLLMKSVQKSSAAESLKSPLSVDDRRISITCHGQGSLLGPFCHDGVPSLDHSWSGCWRTWAGSVSCAMNVQPELLCTQEGSVWGGLTLVATRWWQMTTLVYLARMGRDFFEPHVPVSMAAGPGRPFRRPWARDGSSS